MKALLPLLLIGCAPQDAEVTGSWFTWLAANSSGSVAEDAIKDIETKATIFECRRGWDANEGENGNWEPGYIGPRQDDDPTDERFVGGDCDPDDSECTAVQDAMDEECEVIDALEYYYFLQDDGYYGLSGQLEPWRTEAMLNGEGDVQLTTHHRLGNGEDFRFTFSIKPNFAPIECLSDDDGNAYVAYVDGSSWLEKWSEDEDGYDIYYLNAGGAQQNPADEDVYWFATSDWTAGYAHAKFAAEEFNSDPGYYQDGNRLLFDLGETQYSREDAEADGGQEAIQELLQPAYDEMVANSDNWAAEIWDVAGAKINGEQGFFHKIETNDWREIDLSDSGYDGWIEMHPSWVRVKSGTKFEKGATIEGDYQIYFIGSESGSQVMVSGTFKIEDLREDPWAYPVLEDEKREESGTAFCGGATVGG